MTEPSNIQPCPFKVEQPVGIAPPIPLTHVSKYECSLNTFDLPQEIKLTPPTEPFRIEIPLPPPIPEFDLPPLKVPEPLVNLPPLIVGQPYVPYEE